MRQRYTEKLFNEAIDKARERIGPDDVWVAFDEGTDSSLKSLGAFLIGGMDRPQIGPYLINIDEMKGGKSKHIVEFFEKSMAVMYPDG